MKQFVLFFAAVIILSAINTEANAQRLLGRIFRTQPAATYRFQPVIQQSYSPSSARSYSYTPRTRVPTPVTGYGSNLHRNYMIRRAQQKAAATGIQPRDTANIRWARQ